MTMPVQFDVEIRVKLTNTNASLCARIPYDTKIQSTERTENREAFHHQSALFTILAINTLQSTYMTS